MSALTDGDAVSALTDGDAVSDAVMLSMVAKELAIEFSDGCNRCGIERCFEKSTAK